MLSCFGRAATPRFDLIPTGGVEAAPWRPALARQGEGGTVRSFGGDETRIVVPGTATGNACAIWLHVSPPGFSPPRHIHHREDEIVHVLEGRLRLWCDGRFFEAGAGDTATLPRGLAHSYEVMGAVPARMMTTVVPGGYERFFAAVASLDLPADIPDLLDIYEAFAVETVGRPLNR